MDGTETGSSHELKNNLVGIHAMVFVDKWDPEGAMNAAALARKCGFDIIEIPLHVPDIDVETTLKALRENHLTPTCSLGLNFSNDVSSEDEEVRAKGEDLLLRAVETASKIGSKFLGGIIYSCMGKYTSPPTEKGVLNCVRTLKRVAERAQELGLTLGLEPANRYETNIINTAAETVKLIERIGCDNIVVHLDAYHMHIEERYEDAVSVSAEKAGYFHIAESHRGYLGTGNIDHERIFCALKKHKYKGPIVFESFSKAIIDENVCSALAIWRSTWERNESEKIAKSAREYIRQVILKVEATT